MSKKKNKRNGFVKFLLGILWFLAGIILIITAWFCFSTFDRGKNLNFISSNYSAGLHTNSLYETLAPLIDLKAADTFLSQGDFAKGREAFMQIRSSSLRENFFVKRILSRRLDAAVFVENANTELKTDFIAVLDLGFLSGATRLAPFLLPYIHVENLNYVQIKNTNYKLLKNYIEYVLPAENESDEEKNQFNHFYIQCWKNLVIVSNSFDLFEDSLKNYTTNNWEPSEEKMFTKKSSEPLRFIFNTNILASNILKNELLSDFFSNKDKTILTIGISDYEIRINANVPMNLSNEKNSLTSLLKKDSTIPAIYNHFGNDVQYYTALNFGNLNELKNSIFPILNKQQDMDGLWKTANSLSKSFFNIEIEDLLFSWTTGECVVFGIERSNSPVFGIEISDEKKREEVFDKILNSFILESNTSLIVNGIRLSSIEFPSFINMLLNAFKINLPKPYFFVHKNYIYFSESAQNLVSIFNKESQKELLLDNENWKKVSAKMSDENSFSMFYNLERSMPFFLEGDNAFVKVLKLYNLGRVNLALKNSSAELSLHAISVNTKENLTIPGFPMDLNGKTNYILMKDNAKNVKRIYWIEDSNVIYMLNTQTLEKSFYEFDEKIWVCQDAASSNIWAVSSSGIIYLLSEDLVLNKNFPLSTGFAPSSQCVSSKDGIIYTSDTGSFIQVNSKGEFTQNTISSDAVFKSSPAVSGDTAVFYNKGFEGELYVFKNGQFINLDNPMIVDGIGYGTPALAKKGGTLWTAFITQSGDFYLFADNSLYQNFPIALDNIFYTNAVYFDGAFYVLSEEAVLYKINFDGSFICVKLPEINSAKEGILYAETDGKHKGIYVCGDSNIIYGFNSNLEMLPHYPLAGRGIPVWTDINKDKTEDILILSVDKKLHAWSLK